MSARVSAAALLIASSLCSLCSLFACGGGEESPPLDEMALRDTLLADPGVVAQLNVEVRQRLRARFSAERLRQDATIELALQSGTPLANLVLAMDAVRFSAGRDALLSGTWQVTGQVTDKVQAVAFTTAVAALPSTTLPPLAGDLSGDTILMEQRALAGEAGAVIEALLSTSGSQRIERVVSWPIAALAAGGTVYVNASWLTAMDDHKTGCGSGSNGSGGSGGSGSGGGQGPSGASSGSYMYLVGGEVAEHAGDATASSEADKEGAHGVNNATGFGSCDLSVCDSSCSKSCNSSSCSACDDPTGDKACCRACTIASHASRSPGNAYGALFWMLLPFGFLALRDRRSDPLRKTLSRALGGMRNGIRSGIGS